MTKKHQLLRQNSFHIDYTRYVLREGGSTCTINRGMYSSSSMFYAQNPAFESVHQQSVKVYLHMYNGNVQQNPLCAASSVTKDLPISPRFSLTTFNRDTNSVLLVTHLFCTAVGALCAEPCARNCSSAECEGPSTHTCTRGMFSRTLYAQHPVSLKILYSPLSPGSRLRLFIAMQI